MSIFKDKILLFIDLAFTKTNKFSTVHAVLTCACDQQRILRRQNGLRLMCQVHRNGRYPTITRLILPAHRPYLLTPAPRTHMNGKLCSSHALSLSDFKRIFIAAAAVAVAAAANNTVVNNTKSYECIGRLSMANIRIKINLLYTRASTSEVLVNKPYCHQNQANYCLELARMKSHPLKLNFWYPVTVSDNTTLHNKKAVLSQR